MADQSGLLSKTWVIGIIVLLLVISITPTIGAFNNNDTTPPVTTYTLDPPEPNGCNGWYVSVVNVTLNATDDISGVKEIHYKAAEDEWKIHSGDFLIIVLDYDCLIDGLIEFYAIDFAGNQEEIKSVGGIDIDQLPPRITLSYEIIGGNPIQGWDFLFETAAIDDCSGVDRVEFYLNDVLQTTVSGPGPVYQWSFHYLLYSIFRVNGLICRLKITEESVEFYSIIVKISGSWSPEIRISTCAYDNACNFDCDEILDTSTIPIKPGLYLFQNVTLPINYKGYLGRFFIFATFDTR
jgi:hypothetical protein